MDLIWDEAAVFQGGQFPERDPVSSHLPPYCQQLGEESLSPEGGVGGTAQHHPGTITDTGAKRMIPAGRISVFGN